jgi:hypothetical protein
MSKIIEVDPSASVSEFRAARETDPLPAETRGAAEAARRRKRYLVELLYLAVVEKPAPANWEALIRRALQYGASVHPKITAAEFRELGSQTVRELFTP